MLTQSSATLAYPSFQSPESPVESPAATPAPSEVPPEQPPQESPVAPPPEVPVEVETPLAAPQATDEVQTPIAVTPVPTVEGEEASSTGGVSWAVVIDTLVVGLSSVWLCCGGLALVLFVLGVIATFLLRAT